MDWERRCIQTCAGVLLCAVVLRLSAGDAFAPVGQAVENPDAASFLVYMQTGRVVHLPQETAQPATEATEETTEPTAEPVTESTLPVIPVFGAADLELIDVKYNTSYRPDLGELLTEPLEYDLSGDEPTVLILHTHTSESYTPAAGQDYDQTSAYRTLDENYNMLRIGDEVAQALEEAGISVLHDRQYHDYPSYNDAYSNARKSTQQYIERYPSIQLVLDLHRDAADTATGQMVTECSVGGKTSAQLMFVMGTGSGGLSHPDWKENLSLALKLQVVLEKQNPGICRNINLSYSRYNQHLSPGALLVEVGAAGNTLDEALLAADALAQGIITLFGSE